MSLEANLKKPLVISCAITGAVTTREQHPGLPHTPEEIVESALGAIEGGATIVHIHVREPDGTPSNRGSFFKEVFQGIRDGSTALICASTGSGAGRFQGIERMAGLEFGPDLASFNAGSMNFGDRVFENSPSFLRDLAEEIGSRRILAELECFDTGMIATALRLGKEGLLPGGGGKWWFQLCFGVRGGAPCDSRILLAMRDMLPADAEWSVLAVGRGQLPMSLVAMVEGGHVRTGLEDNIYWRAGELAESNAQLVERIAATALELGRPVATSADTRRLLGLDDVAPLVGVPVGMAGV